MPTRHSSFSMSKNQLASHPESPAIRQSIGQIIPAEWPRLLLECLQSEWATDVTFRNTARRSRNQIGGRLRRERVSSQHSAVSSWCSALRASVPFSVTAPSRSGILSQPADCCASETRRLAHPLRAHRLVPKTFRDSQSGLRLDEVRKCERKSVNLVSERLVSKPVDGAPVRRQRAANVPHAKLSPWSSNRCTRP